jgi:hypothetical protein
MTRRFIAMMGILGCATMAVAAGPALAQLMGRDGYTPPARQTSLAAQFEFQQRMQASGTASTAAGLGALQQYVNTYTSNSTSIGNLNQVNQTLSGGSSGNIGTSSQDSTGNQGSSAETQTKIDNTVKVLEGATETSPDNLPH